MLNKYVIAILLTLVVSSFSESNEIEPPDSLVLKYAAIKCPKPTIKDGSVIPDVEEIELYETYTVICNNNFQMERGEDKVIGIDPVYTCSPKDDGSGALSPETLPTCVNYPWSQSQLDFIKQITADVNNKYAVQSDQIGCWEGSNGDFNGASGLTQCNPRSPSMYIDIGCNDNNKERTMVGYNSLMVFGDKVDATDPLWGEDIIEDEVEKMKIYMECIPAEEIATVCQKVDEQPTKSNTKLYVKVYSVDIPDSEPSREKRLMNIKQSEDIHYRLRCDDGYNFEDGIDEETVYGYCSAVGAEAGANEFFAYTKDAPDTALNCYAKCPANPKNADLFSVGSPVFSVLYMPSLRKGENFIVPKNTVKCADGHSLVEDAPENFEISCLGADTTANPDSGLLSCTDCPVCYAMCIENPESVDKFVADTDSVFKTLTMPALTKGKSHTLTSANVICEDNYSLAPDAPTSFDITCNAVGLLSCETCPKCYVKCPANPDNANMFVAGEDPVFKQLEIEEMIKGQQVTFKAEKVICEDGHDLEEGALEKYTVTCSDPGAADPNMGLLSCGDACPKCYPMCPANPDSTKFADGADGVFKQLTMEAFKKGASHALTKENVVCEENMGVADDAPDSYEIDCGKSNEDGLFECTTCPKCVAQCIAPHTEDTLVIPEENGVKLVPMDGNINLNQELVVAVGDIECKDNYAMSADAPETFSFVCKENGMFSCADGANGCPRCLGTCNWPEAVVIGGDEGYDFQYVDETKNKGDDRAEKAIPGVNHVEAYCTNTSLVILGPRFLSCITNNTMVFDLKGYLDDAVPVCQLEPVCEAPATEGGSFQMTGNIAVGEVYTFTCNEGYVFDLDTIKEHGDEITITCEKPAENDTLVNSKLPAQYCYSGCMEIKGFNGTITPIATRSGGAPYSEGQEITFACNEGYELSDSSKGVQTCDKGKIGDGLVVPTCIIKPEPTEESKGAADRFTASSFLIITLLSLLLWS
ncbi:uncharacterized protein LOC134819501 isoform X2 [Bolinopsis microptera]|uniref:uncharacterized protein LOC134819501 isoform X2 n=1 Tax=Bolinopsis microptera TaxID=2820187 RepID=UPI00307AABA7